MNFFINCMIVYTPIYSVNFTHRKDDAIAIIIMVFAFANVSNNLLLIMRNWCQDKNATMPTDLFSLA